MTHLGNEDRHPQASVDLEPIHGQIKRRLKNAGSFSGVREDPQQLLRGDGHTFLRA